MYQSEQAHPVEQREDAQRKPAHFGKIHVEQMVQMRRASGLTGSNVIRHLASGNTTALQLKTQGVQDATTQDIHQAAAEGIQGSAQPLPHLTRIQNAFGAHDITGVQAYVGGAAHKANTQMGAQAYATGNNVAFKTAPDLHTAAHEAAHIVQQRAGVSLKGGVGEVGDRYEQHADQVADRVVQGKSAQDLLDNFTGSGADKGGVQQLASGGLEGSLKPSLRDIDVGKPRPTPSDEADKPVQRLSASDFGFQLTVSDEAATKRGSYNLWKANLPAVPVPLGPIPGEFQVKAGVQFSFASTEGAKGDAFEVGFFGPLRFVLGGGLPQVATLYGSIDLLAKGTGKIAWDTGGDWKMNQAAITFNGGASIGAMLGPGGLIDVRYPLANAELFIINFDKATSEGVEGFSWGWGKDVEKIVANIEEMIESISGVAQEVWDTVTTPFRIVGDSIEHVAEQLAQVVEALSQGVEATMKIMGCTAGIFGVGLAAPFVVLMQETAYEYGYYKTLRPYLDKPKLPNDISAQVHRQIYRKALSKCVTFFKDVKRGSMKPWAVVQELDVPLNDLIGGDFPANATEFYAEAEPEWTYDVGSMTFMEYCEMLRQFGWLSFKRDPVMAAQQYKIELDSGVQDMTEGMLDSCE